MDTRKHRAINQHLGEYDRSKSTSGRIGSMDSPFLATASLIRDSVLGRPL